MPKNNDHKSSKEINEIRDKDDFEPSLRLSLEQIHKGYESSSLGGKKTLEEKLHTLEKKKALNDKEAKKLFESLKSGAVEDICELLRVHSLICEWPKENQGEGVSRDKQNEVEGRKV